MSPELDIAGDDANDDDKKGPGISGSNRMEELEEPTEDESEEEDEDEDVDFNPLLKGSPSDEEASSSLSSEAEGLEADVVDSCHNRKKVVDTSSIQQNPVGDHTHPGCSSGDSKVDDEGAHVSCEEGASNGKHDKSNDSLLYLEQLIGSIQEKENGGTGSGIDAIEDAPEPVAKITVTTNSRKPIIDLDDEDAICKRTRARYSLARFTLDELETFLQETDDDDDFQNVDEEEEYRKFLAAVLHGGNGDDEGNPNGNDDDEDNDADFEIEIEEALESDVDDCMMTSNQNEEFVRSSRRPETRQNRRQKSNAQIKKKFKEKEKRQLRPLLPVMRAAPISSPPCMDGRYSIFETSPHFPSCSQDHPPNGFMAHQIGQLYYLIYEHVQLLIQIYSLCVLEPSRQHIASEVKGLLSELLHKRDLVLTWRKMPYPRSCFLTPFHSSTASDENRKCPPVEDSRASSQGNDNQGVRWLPSVGSPVLSVLDVAPLQLVGNYFEDVSNAVREHQRRCVESTNIYLEKQPLFPLPSCPPFSELNHNVSKGNDPIPPDANAVSPNPKVPKKTLAATLVESTKKQSVALVSRQIAKLAQPFYVLFNPALFPHKPPSSAVANRVLFTDAEDELLAMGMMEYNNDWKAIKQRLLPCKSEHQIFVRAKNRCSSKASENPIKSVRKMKTSPLTEEEKTRIQEGLKIFKLDWTSIWKFIVPYRDPNLLCRQWRIANGTQKSYKGDPKKKEKRRIYESNRRKSKAVIMENSPIGSDKEDDRIEYSGGWNGSGEDCMENDNEAYLHEAFLADWRPASSGMISSKISPSNLKSRCPAGDIVESSLAVEEEMDNHANQESLSERGHIHEASVASEGSYWTHCKSFQPYMSFTYAPSKSMSKPFVSESLLCSHRTLKRRIPNLVKLAPELPPVKLPPAVRIIPQVSLRTSQLGMSAEGASTGSGHQNPFSDSSAVIRALNLVKPVHDIVKVAHPTASSTSSQKCGLLKNRCFTKERGPELDPQMHPLLFQTLEEGHLPGYSSKISSRIPTFSFFPVAQHQINANLLQNPHPASPVSARLKYFRSKETVPTSSCSDFHPLLQRSNDDNAGFIDIVPTVPVLSTDLELSRDGLVSHADATTDHMATAMRPPTGADAVDLDLDIHLSSASRKRKVQSFEGADVNLTVPPVNVTESIEGTNERTDIHSWSADHHPVEAITNRVAEKSSSATSAMPLPNLDGGSVPCINDNVSDQPFLGIVMEQEELSDSDEEMEDVEFECEEMTDSEGEESANEQVVDALNKEQADTSLGAGHGLRSSSTVCEASEGICAQRRGNTSRSDMVGTEKGSTRSSWLSLNSHGCSPQSRTKTIECSAEGTAVRSNSTRYSKRMTSSKKSTLPAVPRTEMSHPALIVPPSRKSRKQTSKKAIGSTGYVEKDRKV